MKSLMLLWQQMLSDMEHLVGVSTTKSEQYALRRFENEGLEFLTLNLPPFSAGLEKGLRDGFLPHKSCDENFFRGFRYGASEYVPAFLSEFMEEIFDSQSGRLIDYPSIDSIFAVRQLTLSFAKIGIDCSKERVDAAIERYVDCEQEIRNNDARMDPSLLRDFTQMSVRLFGDVLSKLDSDVYHDRLVPKHGPGSTADKLFGNEKYDQTEWPQRMENVFPFGVYVLPGFGVHYRNRRVDFLEPGMERPVRVITVPKTQKTPRIIAIEPTSMQYMQQALLLPMVEYLESDPTIQGMIGFTDQHPNQVMAREGSEFGHLATLDLSEASDRVSYQHVRAMLSHYPHLFEGVDACRSRKADVPGYGVIRLAKFASMGSALCFPFEAMVFLTIIFMAIESAQPTRFTRRDFASWASVVRVYGDDLIIPTDYAEVVAEYLGAFGYKVNSGKSFWTGKFRESCGAEFYDAEDISISRIRSLLPSRRRDVAEILSTVSLRNQFYESGMWQSAKYLDNILVEVLPHFPIVESSSPVLGRHSIFRCHAGAWDEHLHTPLVKGYVVSSLSPTSYVSGEGALMKCLLKRSSDPFHDKDHLQRYGRPDAVRLKLRWSRPF